MRDFTRFALCHGQILAGHGSPCDIGRAGTPPAIYAMTVNQGKGPTPQHVSCSAANASTSEFHMICLTRKSSATTIHHSSFNFPFGHHRLTSRQYASYSDPKVCRKVGSSYKTTNR